MSDDITPPEPPENGGDEPVSVPIGARVLPRLI
jgi:hypothetical protein